MHEMRRKTLAAEIKTLGERQVETIASTASLDREGDRILPSAWRLDSYLKNPVVLWAHDYRTPPIAKSIKVSVVNGSLVTIDEFPEPGIHPLADVVYGLVQSGVIRAKSVGFTPVKWQPNDSGGRDFTEVELLEHSFVSVPANAEAVITARSKSVDRARLDQFLRGTDLDVTEADVRDAMQSPRVRAAIADRVTRRLAWAATPDSAEVFALDDEDVKLDPADARAALDEALTPLVDKAVTRSVARARGRID
jgi:HK97 family phage prohead protease